MDTTLVFLQHYWWFLIALLGALLVFLLFVQGGLSLIPALARTDEERDMLVNSVGRKWEFTFTTLVTFGGAFFASFPLFYSPSCGSRAAPRARATGSSTARWSYCRRGWPYSAGPP